MATSTGWVSSYEPLHAPARSGTGGFGFINDQKLVNIWYADAEATAGLAPSHDQPIGMGSNAGSGLPRRAIVLS